MDPGTTGEALDILSQVPMFGALVVAVSALFWMTNYWRHKDQEARTRDSAIERKDFERILHTITGLQKESLQVVTEAQKQAIEALAVDVRNASDRMIQSFEILKNAVERLDK